MPKRSLIVFLCYASEDREAAERIQLSLAGARFEVFFDEQSLPAGVDFYARIRNAINQCDVFVFLITRHSVAPGKFTLTELKFARERWPSPAGKVLPVNLGNLPIDEIPPYLAATTVLPIEGNAPAEVRAALERLTKTSVDIKEQDEEMRERFIVALPYDPRTRRPMAAGFGSSAAVFYDNLVRFDSEAGRSLLAAPDEHGFFLEMVLFMAVDLLFHVFARSWDIEIEAVVTPIDKHVHYAPVDDAPEGRRVSWSEMVGIFADVDLFRVGFPELAWCRMQDEVVLPPDTTVSWEREDRRCGTLQLINSFVDVRLHLSFHSWAPHLGSYVDHVDEDQASRGQTVTFEFKLDARFSGARAHDPDMPRYRHWYENLLEILSQNLAWREDGE